MTLSLDTAYRSFGGEVEASSTPTICRLPDSRRHQLSAIARTEHGAMLRSLTLQKRISPIHKRMGPGAFKQRGALHLRFTEGFLVDTSVVSESGSAWPLRSSPADMFELSTGATRLAAAYDLDRTLTLR